MSGFLDGGGDLNFNVKFNELINSLDIKRYYSSHWKWLHEQLLFWKQKINQSELFEESEIETILVLLVPYLCQIFRKHKVQSRKEFIHLIGKDIQSLYEHCADWDWKYLLDEPNEDEDQEEGLISETSSSDCAIDLKFPEENNFDMNPTEESNKFLMKIHFLLDLLIPNNFQYFIYKTAFGSNKIFKNREYTLPYPLYFSTKYYTSNVEMKQKVSTKARITRTFKKEDDLNVEIGEKIYIIKPDNKIAVYKSIMPLRMSNEAKEDVWKTLEEATKKDKEDH